MCIISISNWYFTHYSRLDHDKRLDRGRSYANTGKVRHLVIEDPGRVKAIVVGKYVMKSTNSTWNTFFTFLDFAYMLGVWLLVPPMKGLLEYNAEVYFRWKLYLARAKQIKAHQNWRRNNLVITVNWIPKPHWNYTWWYPMRFSNEVKYITSQVLSIIRAIFQNLKTKVILHKLNLKLCLWSLSVLIMTPKETF